MDGQAGCSALMPASSGKIAKSYLDEFIELDRTFHELDVEENSTDDSELRQLLGKQKLRWPDLFAFHRVVLLSEAGSGKTEEIRNAARVMRKASQPAFFLRIEHVVQDFECSFEVGTFEEFEAWTRSTEEGWLFLDSVDEARLTDPLDFERAIRKLGRKLASVLQRSHILISGRTHAWRAKSDLRLCREQLSYRADEHERRIEASTADTRSAAIANVPKVGSHFSPFHIVALEDLHGAQIDAFLTGKGVADPKRFKQEVERRDAWSFTTRPLDLAELVEFWEEHKRIGSRLELMQSSIKRRLKEHDPNRAEAQPIAFEKVYNGVRLVAATATLSRQSLIRTDDGTYNKKGFSVEDVLIDWDGADCSILRSRPIFDPGIYGAVRFHHRSVREYLTAEWLNELLLQDGSRAKIESLFFRSQYGIKVVVPTMRPVLPWMAILDKRILDRVVEIAPEIIFEGGDPSQIDRDIRVRILRQVCELLVRPAHVGSLYDQASVQRFANPDITQEIRELLTTHAGNSEAAFFLLRMVWKAEIREALPEVMALATGSASKPVRIAAYRALSLIGSETDRAHVRSSFLFGNEDVERDLLAELIPDLPANALAAGWLIQALERAPAKRRFHADGLAKALSDHMAIWPLAILPDLLDQLLRLLQKPPVIERASCAVSQRYCWLAGVAAQIVGRMIDGRDPYALSESALRLLSMLPLVAAYSDHEFDISKETLADSVGQWPELNLATFWFDVAAARAQRSNKDERVIDFWRAKGYGHFWRFVDKDFGAVCNCISKKALLDDRLVALSLAFALYRDYGRPLAWRKQLKALTADDPDLAERLHQMLHPPASGRSKWRAQEQGWKRQSAKRRLREAANKQKWKEHLLSNLDRLRNSFDADRPTNDQYYLHQHLENESPGSNKWTTGSWESLVPEFGVDIAQAFREGARKFWRGHCPPLRSEGAEANSISFPAIFGLAGLAIEAREEIDWAQQLCVDEARLATRYALHELNGFPDWLNVLYEVQPAAVIEVMLGELDFELVSDDPKVRAHYLLYDLSWGGQLYWDRLAPHLLLRLRKPPIHPDNLRYMLAILHGSDLTDGQIAKLAAAKCRSTRNLQTAPIWFATWVGVEPEHAIPALAARLAQIEVPEQQTLFAMRFITALMGGRLDSRGSRQRYRTVQCVKQLFLLMHQYIRLSDDIERAGKGVYSPELRDEAQDGRNALIPFIKETPGKEAYCAMREISLAHPSESSRAWLARQALEKATLDADAAPWSVDQVVSFNRSLERTPTNHRDMWELAVEQLLGLKHDLEHGDSSISKALLLVDRETLMRNYIANWCNERAKGRYMVSQEEELADGRKPDLRFHGLNFGPVPCELKLADEWTGPQLFERMENQLCGDYLRDRHSSRGILALVFRGKKGWDLPSGKRAESFEGLVKALQSHWDTLSASFPEVEDIKVIGIDLSLRRISTRKRRSRVAGD